jgi:hypothetical protein
MKVLSELKRVLQEEDRIRCKIQVYLKEKFLRRKAKE